MDSEDELLLAAVATITATTAALAMIKKRRKRKLWAKSWLIRRETGRGILNMLNKELLVEDPTSYRNFLRMKNEQFEYLLRLVESDIMRKNTFMRDSISARSRLEVTLRFLATGETYRSLMYATRIHESTISRFVPEVCQSIYERLKETYLKIPTTVEMWQQISDDFNTIWQFPHCLGAIDGRHIKFRPPRSDGSYYYNYKGDHSIVLLGLADANYKFIYVNIGVNGRISDGGVFRECSLSKALVNNELNFPQSSALPERIKEVPYVIVADDAFPLTQRIMKPYPQRGLSHECRIFNYRLSRARRIIENTFGILANRFRVLLHTINLRAEKVEIITSACVVLHNYLATENTTTYVDINRERNNKQLCTIGQQAGNKSANEARAIREEFKDFFCTPAGSVPWQENAVNRNNM